MKRNIIKLPPYKVERVVSAMSETVDWGLQKFNVPKTWEVTMGEGQTIFILDTAGASDHIDLQENIVGGVNFSASKRLEDCQGHGTHVAGIAVASKNDIGIVGVAPKAKIVLVKVLDDNGSGSAKSIANGLRFCYESLGSEIKPTIISMSLGADGDLGKDIHGWIKKLYAENIPCIVAAGNSGREGVCYPARYEECVAIAAFDQDGKIANFSTRGNEVQFAAPGVSVFSTWLGGSYAKLSGTSQATPFFSGVTALLKSKHFKQEQLTGKNDCISVEDVRQHLIKHSIDMGVAGKDKEWGYGIVDLNSMMKEEN